jgi:hypothetical protein
VDDFFFASLDLVDDFIVNFIVVNILMGGNSR